MTRDHEILHLPPGASQAEIQRSYRDLVRVWHPDRFANDPRLQKIAEEKLREINAAYVALTLETPGALRPSAPLAIAPKPGRRGIHPDTLRALWLAAALIALAVLAFFFHPFSAQPSATALSAPVVPITSGADVSRSKRTAPRASSPAPFRAGVGEIQLHNRTGEDTQVTLTSTRPRSSATRTVTIPASGDALLDNLGPDYYVLRVAFPKSRHPELHLGPFVMVQTESGAGRTSDRYDITLQAQGEP